MAKIIAVANQKGGVAKTTTVLNLGYTLSELGYKVLLVDFDPQSNLTVGLGVNNPDDLETTIYHLMAMAMEDEAMPDRSKYTLKVGVIDLIPGSIDLTAIELELVNTISREHVLKYILDGLKSEYDYIIIDTAPSLGLLTLNALTSCDSVLITMAPQFFSAAGLKMLLKNIGRVSKKLNPGIRTDGILFTISDTRTTLFKEVYDMVCKACGKSIRIFDTTIPASVKVGESNLYGRSIIEYQPGNKVSVAYKAFAKELIGHEG